MAALSRAATDGVINGWKNSHKTNETAWRSAHNNRNYGQILPNGVRPSDQADDGPAMPNNPNTDCWCDVYQAPNGFGWTAWFRATDTGKNWIRSVASHEDGPLVETAWVEEVAIAP
jgi:hypothetical protein